MYCRSRIGHRHAIAACVLLAMPLLASASGGSSPPLSSNCPAPLPNGVAALAMATALAPADGAAIGGASSPAQAPDAEAQARTRERAQFDRILRERSAIAMPSTVPLALPARQRAGIDGTIHGEDPPPVGRAIDVGEVIEFHGIDAASVRQGGIAWHRGVLGRGGDGVAVWNAAFSSAGAKALRIEFADIALADGVELFIYNEDGQVWGPFTAQGPDGGGTFWSPSVFGDTVRVHVRSPDAAALAGSRITLARVMHLGDRVGALQDSIREQYAMGPQPDAISFCGAQVPDCTQDAMCWTGANPGLADASNAIAHIQFVVGSTAYICTGAYLAQTGNAPQQPYFMTANHCLSTQASASSLEAFFKFRTASCGGTCPAQGSVPRVNGSTLLATGALPTYPDFTFLRLSTFPTGGARLLGWTAGQVPESASIVHMGHPAGSPQAFSFRRARFNNSSLPHPTDWPEPTFLYSGLASSSSDWAGAIAGGSSGGPALLFESSSSTPFVGQLLGAGYTQTSPNYCDPNGTSTVDGAFRITYPRVSRYLYDRIFSSGFE